MPQSLSQVLLHLVFSTKERAPYLQNDQIRSALHGYLVGICSNLDCPSIQIGGVADHVHILCRFSKTISIADLVRDLKRESSKWVKEEYPTVGDFHWQAGYAAFSLSPIHVQPLVSYIQNQEEHHRTESFQDELRRVMRQCGVEWDERYVWD